MKSQLTLTHLLERAAKLYPKVEIASRQPDNALFNLHPLLRSGDASDLQVAQLSQACEVVPFGPSLKDLAIPNTIDCNVFGIHGLTAWQVRTQRTVLNSTEMVPHGNFFVFSKYVEDCFLGVWECLIFAAKKPHEVHAASDGGFTGGNTVPHKVRRDK